jgi:4-carboxymuconolactone decarboxylase
MSAISVADRLFADRGVTSEELPASDEPQLPLDEATETRRRNTVEQNYGAVAPSVLQYIP